MAFNLDKHFGKLGWLHFTKTFKLFFECCSVVWFEIGLLIRVSLCYQIHNWFCGWRVKTFPNRIPSHIQIPTVRWLSRCGWGNYGWCRKVFDILKPGMRQKLCAVAPHWKSRHARTKWWRIILVGKNSLFLFVAYKVVQSNGDDLLRVRSFFPQTRLEDLIGEDQWFLALKVNGLGAQYRLCTKIVLMRMR